MFKYNYNFLAEEAALYAVGLDHIYETMAGVWEELQEVEHKNDTRTQQELLENINYGTNPADLYERYTEARHIQSSLISDLSWKHIETSIEELDRLPVDRNYLANWFYNFGEEDKAKLFDPLIEKNFNPEVLEAAYNNKVSESSQDIKSRNIHSKSALMEIADEVWEENYSTLSDKEKQPTRDYIEAWIKEKHPELSDNQVKSLYVVTRRNHGEG